MGNNEGLGDVGEVTDALQESMLLLLPPEARLPILKYLDLGSRKFCRLSCSLLAAEVDTQIGATDSITVNDRHSQEALEFFSRSTWKSVSITGHWMTTFENILFRPAMLQEMRIMKTGSISSGFGDTILNKCWNLNTLKCEGAIVGRLKKEPRRTYFSLKTIFIDLPNPQIVISPLRDGVNTTSSAMDDFLSNQLVLLQRIWSQKPEKILLSLKTNSTIKAGHDLTLELFSFLDFHSKCKYVNIQIDVITPMPNPLLPLQHLPENLQTLPSINIPKKLETEHLFILASIRHFQNYWNQLMSSFRTLKRLEISLTNGVRHDWSVIEKIVVNNRDTLHKLDVRGIFNGPIDLQEITYCPSLKILKIHNEDFENISPNINNFGPPITLMNNLSTLMLTYLQLTHENIASLKNFRTLKHLAVWGIGFQGGINLDGLKCILSIRSLDCLLLHVETFAAADEDAFHALQSVLRKLDCFRNGNYILIAKGRTWWDIQERQEVIVTWNHYPW